MVVTQIAHLLCTMFLHAVYKAFFTAFNNQPSCGIMCAASQVGSDYCTADSLLLAMLCIVSLRIVQWLQWLVGCCMQTGPCRAYTVIADATVSNSF
jgi:hypothetical protein